MLECGYSHLELRLVEAVEAAEAVVPAVVLNTKDSGTFHGWSIRAIKSSLKSIKKKG